MEKVKEARDKRFFDSRHKDKAAREKSLIRADIKDSIELLVPAATSRERALLTSKEMIKEIAAKRSAMRVSLQKAAISVHASAREDKSSDSMNDNN